MDCHPRAELPACRPARHPTPTRGEYHRDGRAREEDPSAPDSFLPAGIHLSIFSDRTETIRASVRDVQFTLVLTIGLVILVLL